VAEARPTGLPLVDGLAALERPILQDFVAAASEYIIASQGMENYTLSDGTTLKPAQRQKAGQIRLSAGLGRALALDLGEAYPGIRATAGETFVSGALRISKLDVVEMTSLDGLKLGVELKPINLAVGRAIWNRFGDIRVSAVSIHLKYPFAVAGGVMTIPVWEATASGQRKTTEHLIERLCELLRRAGGRQREDDAPHRLEGVAVVAFDPEGAEIRPDLPKQGSGLRWEEAIQMMAEAYIERFPPTSAELEAADID
jgi:hypothetical protein